MHRCGLWIFDLCTRQIVQENVDEIHRNRTNGHWNSMVSLFDMASFILALTINGNNDDKLNNSSSSFIVLCNISVGFLLLSACGFTFHNCRYRGDNRMMRSKA